MPSLHVGWSPWCAYAVWSALRVTHPRVAVLPWAFPVLMAADVLATGNHYVLDVVGSVVLLLVSILVTSAWSRLAGRRCRRVSGDTGRSSVEVNVSGAFPAIIDTD
jgi:hypothetical protein